MKTLCSIVILVLTPFLGSTQPPILDQIREVERYFEVHPVYGLNSEFSEFSPVMYENLLVFTSDREYDMVTTGENAWKKNARLNVFYVDVTTFPNDSFAFSNENLFEYRFVSDNHNGPIAFSPDGKLAVFTQVNYERKKGEKRVKVHKPMLMFSWKKDGRWSEPQRLDFEVNQFAYGHATFKNGNTILFSSDIPGGEGGNDLYMSTFANGAWSDPVNLGKNVNSVNDEVFPHYYDKTIFFSSNRPGGSGALDIYQTKEIEGSYTVPENQRSINSPEDDFGIVFATNDNGYFSSNRSGGKGKDDIWRFSVIEKVTIRSDFLAGKFTYRNLNGDPVNGLRVMVHDDDGNLVMETETNKDGEFIFKNLSEEENYIIKIEGDEDLQLVIYDVNGEKKAYLLSDRHGEFVYKRLRQGNVGTLALIDSDDVEDGLGDLTGQFVYEELPGKYANGLKVMLLDENGNIVYTSTTDDYGNFEFNDLPMNTNYTIRMEKLDDDLTLIIFNNDDNVTAILRMDGKGDFVFRKLNQRYKSDLRMLEMEDEDLLADLEGNIFGQFQYRNSGKQFKDGLRFEVINESGLQVDASESDEKGMFRLTGLPLTESYIFRLPKDEERFNDDIVLGIFNRQGKKVAVLDKDKKGYFVYTPLGLSGPIDLASLNFDSTDISKLMKVPTIYYDADSYWLSPDAKKVLDKLVSDLKANSDIQVEINSYADSRASEEYNLELSRKRTNSVIRYLKSKGIPDSRLGGNAYGESKLLNDCVDDVKCPESLHQLNRRSEVRIY